MLATLISNILSSVLRGAVCKGSDGNGPPHHVNSHIKLSIVISYLLLGNAVETQDTNFCLIVHLKF
jgi:hypothetical protein